MQFKCQKCDARLYRRDQAAIHELNDTIGASGQSNVVSNQDHGELIPLPKGMDQIQ
jgi:hypothetical protein